MQKAKSAYHKQYLINLLTSKMQGTFKQSNVYHTFFTFPEKKPPINFEKWHQQ